MDIYIEKEKKQLVLSKSCKVEDLLKELNINSQTVLVVRNNTVVLDDEQLLDDDDVKILSVVSGG